MQNKEANIELLKAVKNYKLWIKIEQNPIMLTVIQAAKILDDRTKNKILRIGKSDYIAPDQFVRIERIGAFEEIRLLSDIGLISDREAMNAVTPQEQSQLLSHFNDNLDIANLLT